MQARHAIRSSQTRGAEHRDDAWNQRKMLLPALFMPHVLGLESQLTSHLFFFFFFFFSRCINDKSPLVLCSIQALAYRLPQAASSQRKRCPFALVCLICVCSIPIESVSSSSALSCCAMSCYAMHDRCTCIHGIHGRDDLIRSDLMWCSSRWCLLM